MKTLPNIQDLLNSFAHPAILLNRKYEIVLANKSYEAVYGEGEPIISRKCHEVSHGNTVPCDLAGEHCPLKQAQETGETAKVLHIHHTPTGNEYVNVETIPIKDSSGKITFFIELLTPSSISQPRRDLKLVGSSPAFQQTLEFVERVAPSETSVLLTGESGTGKELLARTIHDRSKRSVGPFIQLECTGLPDYLFESELFGHIKGAFTGANADIKGMAETAENGTLFLDEVGDIPLSEQVKLLRMLETGQFRRVGSTESRSTDFRLICATSKNLEALVKQGLFNDDLYYRLNVFDIQLPPLRQRREDIKPLIENMLGIFQSRLVFSDEALMCLDDYPFPGNIRELQNLVERAVLMCDGELILPAHLSAKYRSDSNTNLAQDHSMRIRPLKEIEQNYLKNALRLHEGDRVSLAKKLGLSERVLYRKISKLKKESVIHQQLTDSVD